MFVRKTYTPDQTREFGRALGALLKEGDLVILSGDLGAGKTLLTRGIVGGLGGSEKQVHSPSYTYLNIYQAKWPVYHFDVYLLDSYEDLFELGIEELYGQEGVIVIEWGDKFHQYYPQSGWHISLHRSTEADQDVRVLKVSAPNADMEKELERSWPY